MEKQHALSQTVRDGISQAISNKESICIAIADSQMSQHVSDHIATQIDGGQNTIYINNSNHKPERLIHLALRCRPDWIITPKITETALDSIEKAIITGHACVVQTNQASDIFKWTIHDKDNTISIDENKGVNLQL